MHKTKIEVKLIYGILMGLFLLFLFVPLIFLLIKSLILNDNFTLINYITAFSEEGLFVAIINSFKVSSLTAVITTILAFLLAYTIHYTTIHSRIKHTIRLGIIVPMLLPTITYGFAIIYSLGKQGLLTKFFGIEPIQIYGFKGLLIGYVIYALPFAFLIINDAFKYIDKKFVIVSKLMGDSAFSTFKNTVVRPLIGAIGGAFIISFIVSFTDFGIPASIGGRYTVISTLLYQVMLGSIPDFNNGAVIAIVMLLPAVLGVLLLNYLEKFNFHYEEFSSIQLPKNNWRDYILGGLSLAILAGIGLVFIVIFIIPFITNYPYNLSFTLENVSNVMTSNNLAGVYKNTLFIAVLTSVIGTIIAYSAAVINVRTSIAKPFKVIIDSTSMVTNTTPGMVLGIAFLLFFNTSGLKGTYFILIICNIVHFFTTPYLMAKNSLAKLNPDFEITGELMGDTWIKTIYRVIIPNSTATVVEMFGYFFIQSMVTISAIIFLVGARTTVVTSKIKELQHYAKFNEIFVLSLLIFITNIVVKTISELVHEKLIVN